MFDLLQLEYLKEYIMTTFVGVSAFFLGYKKVKKLGVAEDLGTTKLQAETDIITMINDRLKDFEAKNYKLMDELEQMREQNAMLRIEGELLRKEIKELREFISNQFRPTKGI